MIWDGRMELIIKKHSRIDLLDAVRGVAILAMVVYHGLYDLTEIFGVSLPLYGEVSVLEPPFAGAFILLSGISCRFSHSNLRRGLRILAFAALITVFTVLFVPDEAIWFGILHFIGIAVLLFIPFRFLLDRVRPGLLITVLTVLFVFSYSLPETGFFGMPFVGGLLLPGTWYASPYLFWLGFPQPAFASADYFPLIPWLFLFFIGAALGVPVKARRLPERFYTLRVPVLAAVGRNTLLIYVLHQPILYGAMWLIFHAVR